MYMQLVGGRKQESFTCCCITSECLEWGIKMLKPSKRHFLRYDAQTYEEKGFIDLCGIPLKMHNDTTNDQRFAKEPRFWQVTAKAITQNEDATEKRTTFFKFVTDTKITLDELSVVVNDHINKDDDFLPNCVSVMVCARVMTEGGV